MTATPSIPVISKDIFRASARTEGSTPTPPHGSCRRQPVKGNGQRAYQLLSIINPVLHADDPNGVERYKVEPYVIAGDVYSRAPHVGRGGWTWYTGSAGWFYRVIVESILGIERVGDRLEFNPCVPPEWSHFEMTYRLRSTTYLIKVENPAGVESGVAAVWLDNARQPGNGLRLTERWQEP